ncbi:hypothetical protein [Streptacidiphilus rugosus]|uniref:hypothetical protein n=1 Tax=Streptacidiphilus rugosus TaxID=405783 RepID=UPI0012FCADC5|nr:hypothetical protein [Streptacidiphilus rugosus]
MRRRSVLLLVSGVLAVGGIVLPSIGQRQSSGDTRILSVEVNGGKPVVLGPTDRTTFDFAVTAEDKSGIRSVDHVGIWGSNYGVLRPTATTCQAKSKQISVCRGTATVDVSRRQVFDDMAGRWHVQATANANDGDRFESDTAGTFSIQKAAAAVISGVLPIARPGQAMQIEGQLTKPDWGSRLWVYNPGAVVQLLFRPANGSPWQRVATTRTDSHGSMSAEVKASGTGTYAWYYGGAFWSAPTMSQAAQVNVA